MAPARALLRVSPSRERKRVEEVWMRRALDLAKRGTGTVSPNPLVGAVLVAGGAVVGQGWHQAPGSPHAEVRALEEAGARARGATLYVTLEPCSHFGRTPPCAPRVAQAGVSRVVAALKDPNPLVDGEGLAILKRAGVEVSVGVLAEQAARQNASFLKHVRTGMPHVTLKMAASLDGKVAARDGTSRWITGQEARLEVHRMRAAADVVMVGAGTALRDDPALTVRLPGHSGRAPLRVVVDGRGVVPETHQVFTDGLAPTLVATTEGAPAERRQAWRGGGAEVLVLDDAGSSLISPASLLAALGKRDLRRVLVEGGPTLAWELVQAGLVDEVVLFLAPVLIGGSGAPGVLMGEGVATVAEALALDVQEVTAVGGDIKVVARVHGDR